MFTTAAHKPQSPLMAAALVLPHFSRRKVAERARQGKPDTDLDPSHSLALKVALTERSSRPVAATVRLSRALRLPGLVRSPQAVLVGVAVVV